MEEENAREGDGEDMGTGKEQGEGHYEYEESLVQVTEELDNLLWHAQTNHSQQLNRINQILNTLLSSQWENISFHSEDSGTADSHGSIPVLV